MGCFDRSPSDASGAGPTDAGVLVPAGVPDRDPTSPVTACPNSCANTLRIDGCRVVPVNGTIDLSAITDCGAGGFLWSTTSTKLRLSGVDTATVQVRAGAQASAGRGQEIIKVDWSYADCSPLSASIAVTVVDVIFSESAAENYGYDDMDTPSKTDDHVSVKKLGSTVIHAVVKGGLNGNELNFVALDDTKAKVDGAPASPSFDLTIHGGDQEKAETNLVARVNCIPSPEITRMYINVYKEKLVRVVVAKVYDSRHAGTTLRFPNLNIPSAQAMINAKAKAAVVRYEISDYSATGGAVDVPYDIDGNGKLSWDVTADGGPEFKKIQDAFKSADVRIAVIRDLVSVYQLDANTAIGDTTIQLRGISDNNFYAVGDPATIGSGAGAEAVKVRAASSDSPTVTLQTALTKAHTAGDPITVPIGGWSSDPIVIMEGALTEEKIKWTFFHETGHRALKLADLDAKTSIMHFDQGWTDHRLRYKPQNLKFNPPGGTENQWELIPRD